MDGPEARISVGRAPSATAKFVVKARWAPARIPTPRSPTLALSAPCRCGLYVQKRGSSFRHRVALHAGRGSIASRSHTIPAPHSPHLHVRIAVRMKAMHSGAPTTEFRNSSPMEGIAPSRTRICIAPIGILITAPIRINARTKIVIASSSTPAAGQSAPPRSARVPSLSLSLSLRSPSPPRTPRASGERPRQNERA